uniref:hypothetical protein n=1 Tax=Gelidibacter sp. TaxID=2018083 RepID=UPI00404A050C
MKRLFHTNKGFEYIKDNRSLILQFISMTKENVLFTNTDIENYIKAISKYSDYISNNKNVYESFGKLNYVTNLSQDFDGTFYKFIHKETYDNFISKGKFQLGSLQYYREIERDESRDEKEGFSNIILNSNNRQILASVISGFNSYIFCGTYDLNLSETMSKNFGGYILKIKNIKTFADKIKKAIGAVNWQIEKVTYTDYKAFQATIDSINIEGVGPNLSDELFDILHKLSEHPSLFSKPTRFIPEQELRLVFTMSQRVKKRLNFDNLGLLDHIDIIKNTANK